MKQAYDYPLPAVMKVNYSTYSAMQARVMPIFTTEGYAARRAA